ncbi:hypothetical protein JCM10213v2_001014 [Rhodosporidiobolus nylandii]
MVLPPRPPGVPGGPPAGPSNGPPPPSRASLLPPKPSGLPQRPAWGIGKDAPPEPKRELEDDAADDDMIFRKAKRTSRGGSIASPVSERNRSGAGGGIEDDYPYGSGMRERSRSPMSPLPRESSTPPRRARSPSSPPLSRRRSISRSPPSRPYSPPPKRLASPPPPSLPGIPTGPRAFRGANSIPIGPSAGHADSSFSAIPTGPRGGRGGGGLPARPGAVPSGPARGPAGLPARPIPTGPASDLPAIPTGPKAWRTTQPSATSAPFPGQQPSYAAPPAPSETPPLPSARSETPPPPSMPPAPPPAPPPSEAELAAQALERERLAAERAAQEAKLAAERQAREEHFNKEREERLRMAEIGRRKAQLARFLPRTAGGLLVNVQGITSGMMISPGTEFEAEIIRHRRERLPLHVAHNDLILSTLKVDAALKTAIADKDVAKERTRLASGEIRVEVGVAGAAAGALGMSRVSSSGY